MNNDIIEQIINCEIVTGGYPASGETDYIFKTLICPSELYERYLEYVESLNDSDEWNRVFNYIVESTGLTFLAVEYVDEFTFVHITDVSNYDSIMKDGLVPNSSWVSDLGCGVYTIDDADYDAWDTLRSFVSDLDIGEEILTIKGNYSGRYLQCVYGDDHEGYIVIPDAILPDTFTEATISPLNQTNWL